LLHRKERQDETCSALTATLGPSISCEVVPAEGFQQGFSSLPPEIAEELFRAELADTDSEVCSSPLSAELRKVRTTATVNFDNSLSPAHTLVQIVCVYQKVLIYDILRTMKDCNIQVSHLDHRWTIAGPEGAHLRYDLYIFYGRFFLVRRFRYFTAGSDQTRKGQPAKVHQVAVRWIFS
jgi:hypothetical protein